MWSGGWEVGIYKISGLTWSVCPTLDQSQWWGISNSGRPVLGQIPAFWPGVSIICPRASSEPCEVCVLGDNFPKEVGDQRKWRRRNAGLTTLTVVGYSVIMNITMYKISELHEIIWIFHEKWSAISWHRKILQMLLTNDYQGAHQRELETTQWKSKAASCSSVWSSFILRCAVLF